MGSVKGPAHARRTTLFVDDRELVSLAGDLQAPRVSRGGRVTMAHDRWTFDLLEADAAHGIATLRSRQVSGGDERAVAVSDDGTVLATLLAHGRTRPIWVAPDGTWSPVAGDLDAAAAGLSPDGTVWLIRDDGGARARVVRAAKPDVTVADLGDSQRYRESVRGGSLLTCPSTSGSCALVVVDDGEVRVRRLPYGEERVIDSHEHFVTRGGLSSDGKVLALSDGHSPVLRLYHEDGTVLPPRELPTGCAGQGIAFLPDGALLVSAYCVRPRYRLYRVPAKGPVEPLLEGDALYTGRPVVSPDGKRWVFSGFTLESEVVDLGVVAAP